jgi:predicted metal-dependent TIM-barrel fold hydrolase
MWVAVGIHPRSIPIEGTKRVLGHIRTLFDNKQVSALGEVGLETDSSEEEKILVQQMRIAKEYAVPIIIHTPRSNKPEIFNKLLSIIGSEKIDPGKVIIDHLTPDLVPKARSAGVVAGLTVQPGKLTPQDVSDILSKNGPEGIVVNSDLGNVPSDPLALPKVAHHLDRAGFGTRDIELVTCSNIRTLLQL